jgi:hypothetical protein
MQILEQPITIDVLKTIAKDSFGDMVKAVVDVDRGLIALDAELHADLESLLLEDGSRQKDLWGVNLYPDLPAADFLEFDSMINMRPSQGNTSRGVDDEEIRLEIISVVQTWIQA